MSKLTQDNNPEWNREPGIAIVPGSNYQKEMAKFEQFPHDKYAFGAPGNPYVFRPFPKMLYKADKFQGAVKCMAAPPDSYEFSNQREFERTEEAAKRFTEKCQRIVQDETEMSRAMEAGWRETPQEAVEFVLARDRAISDAAAHRNYEDRNMSEAARRESAQATAEAGVHLGEIPEKPRSRRK